MRLIPRHIGVILAIIILSGVCFAPATAQEDTGTGEFAPPNTVFTEIELSDEGVVAYDTLGNRWVYDFEAGAFIRGELATEGPGAGREGGRESSLPVPPVEERCTERKVVQPMEQNVLVGYDEYVDGDITALGRVTVRGWVKGSITSFNGRVLVTESGQVDGDILAPEVVVKPGGIILGEITETTSVGKIPDELIGYSFSAGGLWVVFGFTLFFLSAGFIALTLSPRHMDRMSTCITRYPARSFVIGLLGTLLMPMVLALVAITIVGLLVVLFVPLVYVIAFALGIIVFSQLVGAKILVQFGAGSKGVMVSFVVGLLSLMALWFVVAILLGSNDSVSNGFGIFFLVLAIVITSYPVCAGVGAAVLCRFGFREYTSFSDRVRGAGEKAPSPAPPPMPKEPPIVTPPPPRRPPDESGPAVPMPPPLRRPSEESGHEDFPIPPRRIPPESEENQGEEDSESRNE